MSDARGTGEAVIGRTAKGEPIVVPHVQPFVREVKIRSDDIDPQQHVNNAVYLRWMDEWAYAHSASKGFDWDWYVRYGASFVVRRHEVEYFTPVREGDALLHATWTGRMERFRAERFHRFVLRQTGAVAVEALTHWVFVDMASGRARRMPVELLEVFNIS